MRIVVWGINYAPELTGIGPHNAALCEFLKNSGHDVEMITTFCYYPTWRKLPQDRKHIYRTDEVNGVPVHRCWHYVPLRVTGWTRILHELSFVITSTLRFLSLRRPDLVITVSPPLLIGAAAWLACMVKGAPFIFHVQDLQPDGALELGMLKNGLFMRLLHGLEAFTYRKAHRISGISRGMLEVFAKKQVPPSKLVYFPNTIVIPKPEEIAASGNFRSAHGFPADDFLAVHSGNIGMKHGLHTLVEAARFVKNGRIKILICGDGAARDSLGGLVASYKLKNVLLLPLLSESQYLDMLRDADICLITQQTGSGRSFFPSKLLHSLAYAKPVLAVADSDSELSKALEEGGFGLKVSQDDPEALARELDRLSGEAGTLTLFGKAGRKYVRQFERAGVLRDFTATILQSVE